MAPLPTIPNTHRVAFNWANADNPTWRATNVMHFSKSGGNPADLVTKIDSHVTATMWGQTSSSASVSNLVVTPLDGSSVSFPFNTGSPAKWKGTLSSFNYVPQVACVVKELTGKRGRSYRGRVYLPWVLEDTQLAGLLTASIQGTMQTAWLAFFSAMTADSWDWVVASYKLSTSEKIVAIAVEQNLGTVRKRWRRISR